MYVKSLKGRYFYGNKGVSQSESSRYEFAEECFARRGAG